MNYTSIIQDEEFREIYYQIIAEMGYASEKDVESRDKLVKFLNQKLRYSLEDQLDYMSGIINLHNIILIFGGGPDTSLFGEYLIKNSLISEIMGLKPLIVAIDGSAELLDKIGLIPQIIFTDLDGITLPTSMKDEFVKTSFIIHAHGDNMDKLDKFREFILNHNYIIGTTQVDTHLPVINHGGFTDGDRALFLLRNFLTESHQLYLIGFDFNHTVGKYSKPDLRKNYAAGTVKSKKLEIGARLINKFCLKMQCKTVQIIIKTTSKIRYPQKVIKKPEDLSDWIQSFKD
jgi:uncharacterized Rossmann fold enzyme